MYKKIGHLERRCPKAKVNGTISPFQTREAPPFPAIPFELLQKPIDRYTIPFGFRHINSKSNLNIKLTLLYQSPRFMSINLK
jgi:hypothetical protein